MSTEEKMDVEAQIECLNEALRLQLRSVLMYSLTAGSVIGLEYQAHADKMSEHSLSELKDATRLVEKITALGGAPTVGDGMHIADLALLGQYAASGFATAPDPGGGALLTQAAAQRVSDEPTLLTIPRY